MDRILKEAQNYVSLENVEIFRQHWDEDSVDFEMDRIKGIKSQSITGYGLRIIKDGKIGFTSSTEGFEPSDMVARALDTVRYGPLAVFELPGEAPSGLNIRIFDEKISQLTIDKMVETGEEILEYLKSRQPEFQYDVYVNRGVEKKTIHPGKFEASYERSIYSFVVKAHSFKEGDFFHTGEAYECSVYESREKEIADKVLDTLKLTEGSAVIGTGNYTVVISPRVLYEIFFGILVGLNGRTIEKGSSPLADKMEQRILPAEITIYDDPAVDGKTASAPFDDEGIQAYKKPLIEKGVIKNFILDLRTAGALGMTSTANGSRGYTTMPGPAVSNLVFEPGVDTLEDLIKGVTEGLYIEQVIGGLTGNFYTGDFQLNVDLGVRIEKGLMAGRVKNVMISGNIYKLFESISGISSLRVWEGNGYFPYTRFDKVFVSGNI
jgi:PmbA protein